MWPEPLIASTVEIDRRTVVVAIAAGDGTAVARVLCAHGGPSRCGIFGEMRILDANGAPRQAERALVLLVREALCYAASIGITRVETDVPPRLRAFAARMSGLAHHDGVFAGDMAAVRSHHLRVADADGRERPNAADYEAG